MLWHISSLEQMTGLVSWGEALESVKEQSVIAVTYRMEKTFPAPSQSTISCDGKAVVDALRSVTLLIIVQSDTWT